MSGRVIKFRAWDEGNKIMHSDFQFIRSGTEGNDWILFISDRQKLASKWDDNPFFQQQFHIMQFTGLLDKNGEEIYEGDILSFTDLPRAHQTPFVMAYDESRAGYTDYSPKDKVEVIGNIYENPELVKL